MDLQYTLQLKNKPRTSNRLLGCFKKCCEMLRNAAKKKTTLTTCVS